MNHTHQFFGVVQARMNSSRLPRKVLRPLAGVPMLERIVERLRLSDRLTGVGIATTAAASDDPIVAFAEERGLPVHRGPTDDLAERYHGAAVAFDAAAVVRVWGDCPFIDPAVLDAGIDLFVGEEHDYLTNSVFLGSSYPVGMNFEIYRTRTLADILAGSDDAFHREFPAEFVVANPDDFSIGHLTHSEDLSSIHLTVDYAEDLELAERLYTILLREHGPDFGFRDIVDVLREHPEWTRDTEALARNPEYREKLAEMGRSLDE